MFLSLYSCCHPAEQDAQQFSALTALNPLQGVGGTGEPDQNRINLLPPPATDLSITV